MEEGAAQCGWNSSLSGGPGLSWKESWLSLSLGASLSDSVPDSGPCLTSVREEHLEM